MLSAWFSAAEYICKIVSISVYFQLPHVPTLVFQIHFCSRTSQRDDACWMEDRLSAYCATLVVQINKRARTWKRQTESHRCPSSKQRDNVRWRDVSESPLERRTSRANWPQSVWLLIVSLISCFLQKKKENKLSWQKQLLFFSEDKKWKICNYFLYKDSRREWILIGLFFGAACLLQWWIIHLSKEKLKAEIHQLKLSSFISRMDLFIPHKMKRCSSQVH